ncbi:MAG: tRNA (adenosine(37)-N6)-dimethylallyltransferase MiaA [Planctomycetes bacterium]|nr:tRNA (adenosine(37)-N6)-dimethylallyltransferase MiaA [Planctomycetota bacterium]
MNPPPFAVLVGLTASGKKTVGLKVAQRIGAEIISLDSIKIYRGMNVGSAKPNPANRAAVPFHLLDILDPSDSFSVGQFLTLAAETTESIHRRNKRVLFLGGTAFYLNCLLNGLIEGVGSDPELRRSLLAQASQSGPEKLYRELVRLDPATAESLHQNDAKRIVRALEVIQLTGQPLSWLKKHKTRRFLSGSFRVVGLRWPMEIVKDRIRKRTDRMIDCGLVEEVKGILEGGGFGPESGKAIGYREIIGHLKGESTLDEAIQRINTNTWRFAKRQMTWYKRFPQIQWFELEEPVDLEALVDSIVHAFSQ